MAWVSPARRDGPGHQSKTNNTSLKGIYTNLAIVLHQALVGKQLGALFFETELQNV